MCREHGSARPEGQPRQRYANVVQIVVRNPQFMRAFRQVRKLGCDPAQQDLEFELSPAAIRFAKLIS
jgi:hypothetical protein